MGPAILELAFDSFLPAFRGVPLSSLERRGGTYRLMIQDTCCTVDGSTLADAALAETAPGALLGSVLAAEYAWDAGLPDAAIPGILQAFRRGLTIGDSPAAALSEILEMLPRARRVEAYVGRPDGLVRDRARIAHFSVEALSGRIGNRLLKIAMQAAPHAQGEVVASYRQLLEGCLDDLILAVRDARGCGDYERAGELMGRFFQVCVDVTGADEWRQRLQEYRQAKLIAA